MWGRYGGRLKQKSSYNPFDSPECAQLLLEKGANPNTKDITLLSPLAIACGTGGTRCIELLIKYGADVNSQSESGSTPLHECFFRDNIDCLEVLLNFSKLPLSSHSLEPDTGLKNKYGMLPLEACFIDDMDTILNFVIDQKYEDPNLQVGPHNIKRMIVVALDHSAVKCLKLLLS